MESAYPEKEGLAPSDTWVALLATGVVGELAILRDVDEWADAVEVAAALPGSRFAAAMVCLLRAGTARLMSEAREPTAGHKRAPLDALSAFDHALAGHTVHVVDQHGAYHPLPAARWLAPADGNDHRLLLDHCDGPTIDLGCGPGRLLVALAKLSVTALGVDASATAVAHARSRGASVVHGDVFGALPGSGRWGHALLADGNIGIGGDPVRLLRRAAELVHPLGSVLVEVDPPGTGLRSQRIRLDVDGRLSTSFRWARLGVDAVDRVAWEAGLRLHSVHRADRRRVAKLHRPSYQAGRRREAWV